MNKIFSICIVFMICSANFAGTLIFKDGTRLSGVDIISISDGEIVIEKDKTKRTYGIGKIKSYYGTDLADVADEMPGEFADYTVKIINVNMPKKGATTKKGKKIISKCEIGYSISRKGSSTRIKVPYFYLYVITHGKTEVSGRKIYRYVYPKHAKPKGKGYDEAAIMKKLADFGRPIWNSKHRNFKGQLSGREIEFALKSVGNRNILAWHLEVWGNSEKLIDKTKDMMQLDGRRVGKKWWKRH